MPLLVCMWLQDYESTVWGFATTYITIGWAQPPVTMQNADII